MDPSDALNQALEDLKKLGLTASSRSQKLADIFSTNGPLAKSSPHYIFRSSQLRMAVAINAVIERSNPSVPNETSVHQITSENNGIKATNQNNSLKINDALKHDPTLIIEAETGTGKTFAYLVPVILWGGKTIISTGSKHLQDQLFFRDIPKILESLTVPITITLLKGRANYLCLYHLNETYESGQPLSKKEMTHLRKIKILAPKTKSGDRTDFATIPEESPIWQKITSTRENCLGQECSFYKEECFVIKARRKAQKADIVIVNHHLFFADILLRDTGFAELLPLSNTVIFDEAHLLPDTATTFFGKSISTTQIVDFAQDMLKISKTELEASEIYWSELYQKLLKGTTTIRNCFGNQRNKLSANELFSNHSFETNLKNIIDCLNEIVATIEANASRNPMIEQFINRGCTLEQHLGEWQTSYNFAKKSKTNLNIISPSNNKNEKGFFISWIEIFKQSIQFHLTPLSIGEIFKKQRQDRLRSWIFTSATLSVKGTFSHYARQLGLEEQFSLFLPSPFNYKKQALMYVPKELPNTTSKNFSETIVNITTPIILANKGRALVLCTTLKAVDEFSAGYRNKLSKLDDSFIVLSQGEMNRSALIKYFTESVNTILIGSQSFWEGIDLPGHILSLVIIDKLPFEPPDDPVTAARLNALSLQGEDPFLSYQIPRAVVSLKQGAGRLIRLETDKGLLIICDRRIVNMAYGKKFWQSLPPFSRTRSFQEAITFAKKTAVQDA